VGLEMLFNDLNGFIYGIITYYMINFQAYTHGDTLMELAGFVGICMFTNVVVSKGCRGAGGLLFTA